MTSDPDDVLRIAQGWHHAGRGVALAWVVETWGSSPRRAGSVLAVSGQGEIAGSVSGGCVEGEVVTAAVDALADGLPRDLTFAVADDDAFAAGLACGGRLRVLVEPVDGALPAALLSEMVDARAARQAVGYEVNTQTWARQIVGPAAHPDRFRSDLSGLLPDGVTFLALQSPAPRLIVVGAVHIAQALVPMARQAGLRPVVIDPRAQFATEARFPGAELHIDYPDEVLSAMPLDARSALVALSHDPKIDDPGLEAALCSDAFYVGALGSTRTHAKRCDRLLARGHDAAALAGIHAPVGLDIGAQTPAEIAVAVLAEVIAALRHV